MNTADSLKEALLHAGFTAIAVTKEVSGDRCIYSVLATPAKHDDQEGFVVLSVLDKLGIAHGEHRVFDGVSLVTDVRLEPDSPAQPNRPPAVPTPEG